MPRERGKQQGGLGAMPGGRFARATRIVERLASEEPAGGGTAV
jgi:hypothetical protein